MNGKKKILILLSIFLVFPSLALAGNYTTSISPSGTSIPSPITATFNIQDFSEKDYPFPGSGCPADFVPAETQYNYWFDGGGDFNTISPPVTPTSEEIASGI